MSVDARKLKRFDQLLILGEKVLQTKFKVSLGDFGIHEQVDDAESYEWAMKCLPLLEEVFGRNSNYYNQFKDLFEGFTSIEGFAYSRRAVAVLRAAKEDYENGNVNKLDNEINLLTKKDDNQVTEDLKRKCDEEAARNTRLYSAMVLTSFVILIIFLFYYFGLQYASILTLLILIFSFLISVIALKEWTPTKVSERIYEIEKNRIYKRFGIG